MFSSLTEYVFVRAYIHSNIYINIYIRNKQYIEYEYSNINVNMI